MSDEWASLDRVVVGFLLVLARVSGVVALAPVPGWKRSPEPARVLLAFCLTMALLPAWPRKLPKDFTTGSILIAILQESSLGLTFGVGASIFMESFILAAQMFGLQAGYAYASTIDPTSEADAGVLQVMSQLSASLLFFSMRLDDFILRALAGSFETYAPGTWSLNWRHADAIIILGTEMWKTAIRLALPLIALLLMLDIALALMSRVQAQLQLLTLAFPAKMLMTLATLAVLCGAFPGLIQQQFERTMAMWSGGGHPMFESSSAQWRSGFSKPVKDGQN